MAGKPVPIWAGRCEKAAAHHLFTRRRCVSGCEPRGLARDARKLAALTLCRANARPNQSPPVPHLEIDNRHGAAVQGGLGCAPTANSGSGRVTHNQHGLT
jgi:hypothetical protein